MLTRCKKHASNPVLLQYILNEHLTLFRIRRDKITEFVKNVTLYDTYPRHHSLIFSH